MLKIHAKILSLNIFKKYFFSPKIRLKILKKIQNLHFTSGYLWQEWGTPMNNSKIKT